MHLKCSSLKKKKKSVFFFNDSTVHLTKESISGFCRKNPMVKMKSLTLVAFNNRLLCLREKKAFSREALKNKRSENDSCSILLQDLFLENKIINAPFLMPKNLK